MTHEASLSLSLSLSHTHTHTQTVAAVPSTPASTQADMTRCTVQTYAISNQVPAKRRISGSQSHGSIRRDEDARHRNHTSSRRGLAPPGVNHRDLLGRKANGRAWAVLQRLRVSHRVPRPDQAFPRVRVHGDFMCWGHYFMCWGKQRIGTQPTHERRTLT